MSNQTNELKNMMASFFQMNTASTSGTRSLPSNTVANPKGELKAITTRSGLVLDGPSVHVPPPFINPEEDERVEETLTDLEHGEFTIKVPSPLFHKAKPHSQRNYVVHQSHPRYPHIPYSSRMNQEKQKEKDEVQIHKFWQMFKQLHINITLADALILIPKYQKMLKSILSNKEKLLELANIPLNENCSAVILKKLPEKLGDPRKFLIPCGFSKLKCKALANLGASINLMPLSANQEICTPVGIARDVFVPVGKFTFPANFIIVDYESDPRVPLILGRHFLRTARALIDVHGEEMILRVANETHSYHMSIGNDDLSLCCGSDLREIEYFAITMILSRYMDLSTLKISGSYLILKEEKNTKIIKILIDDLNLHGSKVILIHENLFEITNCATPEKNVKKATNASLILEDSYPPLSLYELPFYKEVPRLGALLSFSSKNEEKVFNPGILTSKRVHTSFLPKLSHRDSKAFKVIKIFESPMEIFPCCYGEDIRILDVLYLHFYPP
ncbi:reverse transcriptase domain-containing protein [Tanacetum coccineum]